MLAKVPTAPEIAQVEISSRAATSRARARAEFRVREGQLEAEGGGLGVNSMRPADRRGRLMLKSAPLERREQRVNVGDKDVARAPELYRETRVEHVGAGEPQMDETRVGADELGKVSEEGDDIVLGHSLDLVDSSHVELGLSPLLPDRLGRRFRDHADLRHRFRGVGFDLEPDAEARLGRPHGGHLGAGIARDHWRRRFLFVPSGRGL